MELMEACEIVQAWGRQHEAAMTIARAVQDKAALANEIREIETRLAGLRAEDTEIRARLALRDSLEEDIANQSARLASIRAALRTLGEL
ncbi:MAG: hypothetical protein KIT36_16190 [Alphaproteobacteria bacterium]|nr:hypothetical protein [Alphaproteobacteria bacterium]